MYKIIRKYLQFILLFSIPIFGSNLENVNIFIVSLAGIAVVMIALTLIYLFMKLVTWIIKYSKFMQLQTLRKKKNKLRMLNIVSIDDDRPNVYVVLAISTAIHIEMKYKMEEEKAILTINKLIRPYSPWSSKILSMRKVPDRK